METSISAANHVVLHAKAIDEGWDSIETCNSDVKDAVLNAKTHR